MRQLRIISFTSKGTELGKNLSEELKSGGILCQSFAPFKYASKEDVLPLPEDAVKWIGKEWGMYDYLFIGAVGIAVRYTAPWIKDKYTDPAVIGMDEKGRYVIPLLSGHVGGAVELSRIIADILGAEAVITTATDVRGKFAADVFARKNHLAIHSRKLAKEISAFLLEGQAAGFYSAYPVRGRCPEELQRCSENELTEYPFGIWVGERCPKEKKENVLYLTPKNLAVGIGCRRGTAKEMLLGGLWEMLETSGYEISQIACIASIDLKKEEEGLICLAKELEVPFFTYSAEELQKTGDTISGSEFVWQVTGVDNVCERSALLAGEPGRLAIKKTIIGKATYAAAVKNLEMEF